MAELILEPVPVNTGSRDEEGRLVLVNGCLVAVLVRLADGRMPSRLERGFSKRGSARVPAHSSRYLTASRSRGIGSGASSAPDLWPGVLLRRQPKRHEGTPGLRACCQASDGAAHTRVVALCGRRLASATASAPT